MQLVIFYTISYSYCGTVISYINGGIKNKENVVLSQNYALKDINIHSSTQVVNVRHKDKLFAFINKPLKQTGVVERTINVTMARWIPAEKE